MKIKILFLISIIALGCSTPENKNVADSIANDTVTKNIPKPKKDSVAIVVPHFSDSVFVKGNQVVFLRPDSARFEAYSKNPKSRIYAADADFGNAISMAIDTIIMNKHFKGIKAMVSTKRYIVIKDCKNGPVVIDRDTVDYGIIISAKGNEVQQKEQIYGGHYYIGLVRKYFKIK